MSRNQYFGNLTILLKESNDVKVQILTLNDASCVTVHRMQIGFSKQY